jgi:hypothetical protein
MGCGGAPACDVFARVGAALIPSGGGTVVGVGAGLATGAVGAGGVLFEQPATSRLPNARITTANLVGLFIT